MKVFAVAESKEQQETLTEATTRGRHAADYLGLITIEIRTLPKMKCGFYVRPFNLNFVQSPRRT